MKRRILFICALIILLSGEFVYLRSSSNATGFDTTVSSINTNEIQAGGPAKDAIPALNNPEFASVADAKFIFDTDMVLGVQINGLAKAYPIKILNWHEGVNDTIGSTHLLATW